MLTQTEIDWRSPIAAFAPVAHQEGAALLHGGDAAADARWSFITANPVTRIESAAGETRIDGEIARMTPFAALAALHAKRRHDGDVDCGAPLASGLVGFAGYECGVFAEPAAAGPASPYSLPDFSFSAYDAVAAFDRKTRRAFLIGRSADSFDQLDSLLGRDDAIDPEICFKAATLTSNFTGDRYRAAVAMVIERILEGELFQANISQRLEARGTGKLDPYALFAGASQESSAAFGAYLPYRGSQVLSLSPERFFTVRPRAGGGMSIVAEPIKGTAPRGADAEEDARLRKALADDPKERAENIMIADLTRNDLSRICADRTIKEEAICEVVSHATVHHLLSRISGVLRQRISAADAFGVLFPCGSVTGAPKVQAMKLIAEIEGSGRGPYCGAIGYFDDRGGADLSVAIRLAVAERERLSLPVGGGVTLRSDPQAEYDETLAKAQHLLRHIGAGVPE